MIVRNVESAPIEKLFTNPQVRKTFDESSIDGMAESIRRLGLLQPILTRPAGGKLLIVDGERRYRAALKAGLKTVPVFVDQDESTPEGTLETQLVANIQREDLRPTEKASAIEKLIQLAGVTASDAAARLGLSGATVTRLLALLKLPEPIRRQIDAGEIPASAGYDLAKIDDAVEQSTLASQLADGEVTRDAVSGAIKSRRRGSKGHVAAGAKRIVVTLGEGRSVAISGGTTSLEALIGVFEELLAKARKARTRGWTLPTFLKVARDSRP